MARRAIATGHRGDPIAEIEGEGATAGRIAAPAGGILSAGADTLILVARCGSFSGAARLLGVRQSTVSRQVRSIEDEIGVSLFERQGIGIRPTDAGQLFLARLSHVRQLVTAALDEASEFGRAKRGQLRVGFAGSFASSPAKDVLQRLKAEHPDVRIQLVETGAAELIQQVLRHELDCAWVGAWRPSDPALVLEPLWQEFLFLASSPGLGLVDAVRWADLSQQTLLVRPEAELDLLFPVLEKAGVSPPDVQFHDCSRESLMMLVAEGQGVAIVSESFAKLGRPGVHFSRIDEPEALVTIQVVYRRDRDNPAFRRLLAVTRGWLKEWARVRAGDLPADGC